MGAVKTGYIVMVDATTGHCHGQETTPGTVMSQTTPGCCYVPDYYWVLLCPRLLLGTFMAESTTGHCHGRDYYWALLLLELLWL